MTLRFTIWLVLTALTVRDQALRLVQTATPARMRDERGDVPGWVLITIMTVALVILIWGLAGPALSRLFTEAFTRVTKIQ